MATISSRRAPVPKPNNSGAIFGSIPFRTEPPPTSLAKAAACEDPLFFAAVDPATGRAGGRLALMRIDAANGVIEVGHILFGPRLARTRAATEAIYLLARHVFDDLGYRRFEWKCDDRNEPSK